MKNLNYNKPFHILFCPWFVILLFSFLGDGKQAFSQDRGKKLSLGNTSGVALNQVYLNIEAVNDDCSAAQNLTSNVVCSTVSGTTINATQSQAAIACNGFTSNAAKDVWYTFTAFGAGDSVIVVPTGGFDPIIQLFSGSCSTLVNLACADAAATSGTEKLSPGNLTAGQVYYIRVYGWNGADGQFSICVKQRSVPQAPVNDACSTAIALTSGTTCGTTVYSSTNATQSLAPVLCSGTTASSARDVWFSFVAGTAGDSVIFRPSGSFDGILQVYSGTCTNLVSLGCSDVGTATGAEKVTPGTLTPGQTYYARVYGWAGATGSFTLCVKQPGIVLPPNDNCANSIALVAGTTCNPQIFSTSGATQSFSPNACNGQTSSTATDIWFSFTSVTAGDTVIVSPVSGGFNPIVEIFSGNCTNPSSIGCSNNTASTTATEKLRPGNLVPGTTYLVRVYGFNTAPGQFSICVKQVVPEAPANDNCNTGVTLTSAATCDAVSGTTIGATQSQPANACSGFTSSSAKDVWYTFTAFGAGDSIIVVPTGTFDPVVQIFSGSCSTLVSLACIDANTASRTEKLAPGTLIAGQVYRIRVYGWNGADGQFSICVKRALTPQAPANDNCIDAIVLTSSVSCNATTYSSAGANQSLPPVVCTGFTSSSARDVWFTFIAGTAGDSIILRPSGTFDAVLQLYSGTCTSPVSLACTDISGTVPEKLSPGNLVPGQTYLVRVYGWGGATGSFTLCVRQPTLIPSNDDCAGSALLISGFNCNPQTYSNANATQSFPPNPCSGVTSSSGQDIWFSFSAVTSGDSVIVGPLGGFNPVVEIFSGNCANLSALACSNNPISSSAAERISTGTLTVGTTYFVRVYGFDGTAGQFTICIKRRAVTAPPNDNCTGAISLIPSASCNSLTYSNTGATQSLAPVNCNGATSSSAPDVWFSFVASGPGDSVIVSPGAGFDPVIQLFGGSSCNGLVPLICSDNPSQSNAVEKIATGGLSTGVTYWVRVYGWNGAEGQFNFCIKQPGGSAPASDNCSAAIQLTTSVACNPQTFSTAGATQSLAPVACGGIASTTARDVWFRFGPSLTPNDTVIVSPIGNFNPVVEVFSGLCTNLTSIGCASNPVNPGAIEKVSPGNLNLSVIYYVRVYGFDGSEGQFSICVKAGSATPAPANNNCTGAFLVTPAAVCNSSAGTALGASQSLPPIACGGTTSSTAQDVWYRFTAATAGDSVIVVPVGSFDPVVEVFSGNCTALSSIGCSDQALATSTEKVAPGNLIIGQTYYFRVYGWNGTNGTFNYCVKSPVNCNSVAGTLNLNTSETVSNAMLVLNLTGSSAGASVQWQASIDNSNWSNAGAPVFQSADTFYISSAVSQNYYLRALVTLGSCVPATSNVATVFVSCATPLTNKEPALSGFGISGFSFAGINNSSFSTLPGGAFQNFRLITGQACRGISYPFTITALQNTLSAKAVWIDFNNNGSFADPGENVVAPNVNTGNLTGNITIPAGTTAGLVRVRVMLYSPGTSFPSTDPCFVGPYEAGEIEEYSLNISNAPTAANAGSNTSICGFTYTLGANPPASGTGQWTVVSGSGNFSSASSPTATVSGLSTGVNIFRWTISTPCSTSTSEVIVTSVGGPQTPFAGGDQSVCGTEASLSANTPSSGTGLWTVVSGSGVFANASNPATTVTGLGSGANIFRWTISSPPCLPVSDDVQITNTGGSSVVAQAGADQTICQTSATLSGNNPGSGSGIWTLVAGTGTIQNPSNPNTTVSGLGQGTNVFRWTITTGSCPPSSDDVSVSIQTPPSVANAGPDQIICAGQTLLAAVSPSVGTGIWSLVTGTGVIVNPLNPASTVTGLTNGTNVFRWTVSNGNCPPSTDEVIISTNLSAVAANAGLDQLVCQSEATLAANNPGTGTGQWILVSGSGTIANTSSPSTTVTGLGTGENIFRWTITSPGCDPSSDEVSLFRNLPALAAAGPDQQLCTGQATLAAISPSSGTGIWTLVSGSGTIQNPADPATVVTGLGNGSNVFRWTVSNPPCAPVSDEVTITTNLSAVAANAGPDQNLCGFTSIMAGNNPGSGTGLWAVVQGSGIFIDPASPTTPVSGLATGTNIFSWTINPGGACSPTVDLVTIEASGGGVVASAGADQSVCGSSATLAGNSPGSGGGAWTRISGSGDVVNPSSPNSPVVNLGPGTNVFRWTIFNAPCPNSSDEVVINSTPSTLVANAGPDQTVCGANASLNAVVPASGNGTWTLVSGGGSVAQPGSAVSSVTGLGFGSNVFLWTVSSGACTASDVITVNREANPLNLGNDTVICETAALVLGAGGTFSSYLWSDNSTGPNLTVGSSGLYWLQVVTANSCVFSDTIRVIRIPCTSVEKPENQVESLLVFPNPSDGLFRIADAAFSSAQTEYRVYSSEGKEIYFTKGGQTDENGLLEINLRGRAPGLYLLESRNGVRRHLKKLVLK